MREDASAAVRDILVPAMPDDGRSFFTITMAQSAIRDLAKGHPMRLPEGWAPPRATVDARTEAEKSKPTASNRNHAPSSDIEYSSENNAAEQRYEEFSQRLRSISQTDIASDQMGRKEQSTLREWLFKGRELAACAICGKEYTVGAMRTAHKKKRSECSEEERRDPNIVMPLCVFGCDFLYEERYLYIEDGVVRRGQSLDHRSAGQAHIDGVVGNRVNAKWLMGSRYFPVPQAEGAC